MTLNGIMTAISVISPNSVALWARYAKVVEDTLVLSATEM